MVVSTTIIALHEFLGLFLSFLNTLFDDNIVHAYERWLGRVARPVYESSSARKLIKRFRKTVHKKSNGEFLRFHNFSHNSQLVEFLDVCRKGIDVNTFQLKQFHQASELWRNFFEVTVQGGNVEKAWKVYGSLDSLLRLSAS